MTTATATHTVSRTVTLRLPDRDRAMITLTVTPLDAGCVTVDHTVTTEHGWRVSISGLIFGYRAHEAHSAGQIQGSLPELHPIRLAWEQYHLNDMHSRCAHQPDHATVTAWQDVAPCPETGYRAGSAWLVKPITDAEVARLIALFDSYK